MDKYAQLRRFRHEHQLQVYMYAFIYAYPDTMPVEDYFPNTTKKIVNYN